MWANKNRKNEFIDKPQKLIAYNKNLPHNRQNVNNSEEEKKKLFCQHDETLLSFYYKVFRLH